MSYLWAFLKYIIRRLCDVTLKKDRKYFKKVLTKILSGYTNVAGSSGSCTGNAVTATKATQDGNGRNIAATYLPKSDIGINYGAGLTTTKSIPNDAETEILSVTIGVAGVYLIHGQANFASNKTGLRRLELKNSNANGSFGGSQVGASGSGKTDV